MKPDNNSSNNGEKDSKGRFLPGNSGKPKGSSKNKLRDEIRTFLNENWSNFPEWFSKLKPKEKIDTILDLMPYAVSRLQSISMTDSEGADLETNKTFVDYTKLSSKALKEILQNTHTDESA